MGCRGRDRRAWIFAGCVRVHASRLVRARWLDPGIAFHPASRDDIESEQLFMERLVLAVGHHLLAKKRRIRGKRSTRSRWYCSLIAGLRSVSRYQTRRAMFPKSGDQPANLPCRQLESFGRAVRLQACVHHGLDYLQTVESPGYMAGSVVPQRTGQHTEVKTRHFYLAETRHLNLGPTQKPPITMIMSTMICAKYHAVPSLI
ncbi:hypothetical protein BC2230_20747 [Burkholderia cepacia]